jgi:hypothetical protein
MDRCACPLVVMLALLGFGCGDSGGGGSSSGDTMGDGDGDGDPGSDPEDPLDDGGAEPPGDPDTELVYPSPTTLGNGMVHDTRYLLEKDPAVVTHPIAGVSSGVPWSFSAHQDMLNVGFRPAQIHAAVEVTQIDGTNYEIEIEDDSIYISDDDANYLYRVETYVFGSQAAEKSKSTFDLESQGFRPVLIDVVNVSALSVHSLGSPWHGSTTLVTSTGCSSRRVRRKTTSLRRPL